jgi:signal transduction histidine kinase
MTSPTTPARTPLALRLSLLGLGQLAVLAAAALVIGELVRPPPPHDLTVRVDDAVEHIEALEARADLEAALAALADAHGLSFSLYGEDGELLASSSHPPVPLPRGVSGRPRVGPREGPPPFPPPWAGGPPPWAGGPPPGLGPPLGLGPPPELRGSAELGPLSEPPPGPGARADLPPIVRLLSGRRALTARGEPPPGYLGPLLTALVGLVVIVAGAFLTARWIVRPLESIARAASKVGAGDLTARTSIVRGDELGTVARTFDDMAVRVEDMVRAERELLANVSHELRTPLARVRVALDLAAEGHADALADVALDVAELEGIVDDVLLAYRFDASRGRQGLPVGTLLQTRADDVCREAQRRFAARHPERPLALELAPDLPDVLADAPLLRRTIDNLLDNAHKYTPDRAAPIRLVTAMRNERIEIAVIDRGMGISPEDLPHVFEPFFRADRSRTRGAGGVGLGLALAQRIVQAHEGSIDAESELGRGTTVRIALPPARRAQRSDT